jgi:hypothetical protein
LNLNNQPISDENWTIICESLQAHPTLTSLNLIYISPRTQTGGSIALSTEQRAQRSVRADMMKRNTSLHTIRLCADERDKQIYAARVHPYLEINRYRPRVLALTKAGIPLRRPFLGLALQTRSVRNKSNLLWMFLSRNPDVVVLSNEDDEQVVEAAATEPVEASASAPVDAASTRKRTR